MRFISNFLHNKIERRELFKVLNIYNLEKLKKSDIKHIGKNVDGETWYLYKKKVLLSWMNLHEEFKYKYQNKAKKFIKKLELEVDDEIKAMLISLERREFTTRRSFKIIEIPFEHEEGFLGGKALLVYKSTKIYDNSEAYMKLITNSDLYIFDDKLVWYDAKIEEVVLKLEVSQIKKMNLYNYGLEVIIGTKKMVIRYKDNHIIKISLDRILKKENILSINFTREVRLKNIMKKKDL